MRRHGTGQVDTPSTDGEVQPGGPPSVVHTRGSVHGVAQPVAIYSSGVLVGQRAILDFVGPIVADVAALGKVTITISTTAPTTSTHMKCYPTAAPGVSIPSTIVAWVPGAWTQIVPPSTIANAFQIIGFTVRPVAAAGEIEFGIGSSPASSIITWPETDVGDTFHTFILPVPISVPANSEVRARLSTPGTTIRTYTDVKILYYDGAL